MELKFTGTVPWVAFSQFEYKGDCEGFIKTLKEIEAILPEIPDAFGVAPNDKMAVQTRLEQQNKVLIKLMEKNPELRVQMKEAREELNNKEDGL